MTFLFVDIINLRKAYAGSAWRGTCCWIHSPALDVPATLSSVSTGTEGGGGGGAGTLSVDSVANREAVRSFVECRERLDGDLSRSVEP